MEGRKCEGKKQGMKMERRGEEETRVRKEERRKPERKVVNKGRKGGE